MTGKRTNQRIAFWIFRILGLIVVGILFWILGFIIWHGAGVINWKFLTTAPTDGMTGGGIFPAIVGTFCLIAGSMVVAFPLGVMSAIYTTEYAGNGKIVRFIRIMTNNLGSIPSIIFGLFGMALFVNALGFGDSIIAGSFTLGLLALPLVIRTTEEALKAVPDSYRTGSLALGATTSIPRGAKSLLNSRIFPGLSEARTRRFIRRSPNGFFQAFSASFCASASSLLPFSARSSRRFRSSRVKGSPSAVPWISTKAPLPVMTTFISVSLEESST